jgi:hypothetical protein
MAATGAIRAAAEAPSSRARPPRWPAAGGRVVASRSSAVFRRKSVAAAKRDEPGFIQKVRQPAQPCAVGTGQPNTRKRQMNGNMAKALHPLCGPQNVNSSARFRKLRVYVVSEPDDQNIPDDN